MARLLGGRTRKQFLDVVCSVYLVAQPLAILNPWVRDSVACLFDPRGRVSSGMRYFDP